LPERVEYPEPLTFKPDFADETLDVYAGTPTLVAIFPDGAFDAMTAIRGTVTAQACNDQICLPPSDLQVSVPLSGPVAGHSN
jgi:thiol:disulfide interchange protein DsbD